MTHVFVSEDSYYKSPTAEGVFLEAAMVLQSLESYELTNPNKKNNINIQINTDALTATISAIIPIQIGWNGGKTEIEAYEYLTGPTLNGHHFDITPNPATTR